MVEQYLGKEAADDIFFASMLSGLIPEKQACELAIGIKKEAISWGAISKAIGSIGASIGSGAGHVLKGVKTIPPAIGHTALLGGATGVLGATIYDIIKERVSQEDPEAKFNSDIEHLYMSKKRETEDARWMDRVRTLRDELKRGYKKMTTEEYAQKYKALMDALNERSA